VAAPDRRDGMMSALVEAAVAHAGRTGARIVEAYPHDRSDKAAAGDVFMGLASAFRRCGFHEVARRTPKRPVMRRQLR
jgi:hypothetical protein